MHLKKFNPVPAIYVWISNGVLQQYCQMLHFHTAIDVYCW